MFFKNFLFASRNLTRFKIYNIINVIGLAISFMIGILTIIYVENEYSYDKCYDKYERIYRIYQVSSIAGGTERYDAGLPMPTGIHLSENISGIESLSRVFLAYTRIWVKENSFREPVVFADPSIFQIFSFSCKFGNKAQALQNKKGVFLSEAFAEKLFDSVNPIGRTISINSKTFPYKELFTVEGVIKKIPGNTTLRFSLILPFENLSTILGLDPDSWNIQASNNLVYVKLAPVHNLKHIELHFSELFRQRFSSKTSNNKQNPHLRLQPLTDIHLNEKIENPSLVSVRNPFQIYLLILIAVLVFVVTLTNFNNLMLGCSIIRAKEIGVRKVFGASKGKIILQIWTENLILCIVALVIGLSGIEILFFFFDAILEHALQETFNAKILIYLIFFVLFVSFTISLYPAIFLSRLAPREALNFTFSGRARSRVRGILLVLQFSLSISFVIVAIVMYKQIDILTTQELGFNTEDVIVIPCYHLLPEEKFRVFQVFLNELPKYPGVLKVSGASFLFNRPIPGSSFRKFNEHIRINFGKVHFKFFDLLEISVKEGNAFSSKFGHNAVMVNNAWMQYSEKVGLSLERFTLENLHGQEVKNPPVLGVVNDFNVKSLHNKIEPMIFGLGLRPNYIYLKIQTDKIQDVARIIKEKWYQISEGQPFLEIIDLSEYVQLQYAAEKRWMDVIGGASIIIIVITLSGSFGVSALLLAQQKKEVAIKKILGASVSSLVLLLFKKYLVLALVANLISYPIAYFVVERWLRDFAYQVHLDIRFFFWSSGSVLLLIVGSVCYNVIQAIRHNPIESLRTD